jgi:hypothetical protein
LFFLAIQAFWLRRDQSPPAWDDAFYLSQSLRAYDALTEGGLPAYGRQLLTGMREKPPLIAALPTPVYLLIGRNPGAALIVNLVALLAMFLAIYCLARRYAGERAALLAVAILGGMPMIYGLSHWYLVECGLTAIVCVTIALAAADSPGLLAAAVGGALFGLGALMKLSFPLYVAGPLAFLWYRKFRWKSLAAFLMAAAIVAGPWFASNFAGGLRTALRAGSGDTARTYGTGAIFSLADIGRYLSGIANCGPALYFIALAVALAACYQTIPRRGLLLCAVWASPLLLLAAGHYRDLRYAAPLFPAFALALGFSFDAAIVRFGKPAAAIVSATLVLGVVSMLHTSFGGLDFAAVLFDQPRFSYAARASTSPWPFREILQDPYRSSSWSGGERKRIVVANDTRSFNLDNLSLAALSDRLPFDGATTAYQTDSARLRQTVSSAAYFFFLDGGEPESPFNLLGGRAIADVEADPNFVEAARRPLPDGATLHVFRNRSAMPRESSAYLAPGLGEVTNCSINFDGQLELSGLAMHRNQRTLEVQYRWRCLKPVRRNYWCFTHIVDDAGNVVGYLDHPVMKGDPPTSQWAEGSVAIERLHFDLPLTTLTRSYHLRLGLFHRESGERLPITSSSFALADSQTAAVTPPAQ